MTDLKPELFALLREAVDKAGLDVSDVDIRNDHYRVTWYTWLAEQAYALGLSRDVATVEKLCDVAIDDWRKEADRLKAQRDAARGTIGRRDAHIVELTRKATEWGDLAREWQRQARASQADRNEAWKHLATHTAERDQLAIEAAALRIQHTETTTLIERIRKATTHECGLFCDNDGCYSEAADTLDLVRNLLAAPTKCTCHTDHVHAPSASGEDGDSFHVVAADCPVHHSDDEPAEHAERPTIVVLCGSSRFSHAFREANLRETLAGRIVLSIGCDMRSDHELFADLGSFQIERIKADLDELHKRKIDLADEVLVLNVGRYIGDSTRSEVEYAEQLGKPIRYLEPVNAISAPAAQAGPAAEPWWWELQIQTGPASWEIHASGTNDATDPGGLARLIADRHAEARTAELADVPWRALVWPANATEYTPATAAARVTSAGMALAKQIQEGGLTASLLPRTYQPKAGA